MTAEITPGSGFEEISANEMTFYQQYAGELAEWLVALHDDDTKKQLLKEVREELAALPREAVMAAAILATAFTDEPDEYDEYVGSADYARWRIKQRDALQSQLTDTERTHVANRARAIRQAHDGSALPPNPFETEADAD